MHGIGKKIILTDTSKVKSMSAVDWFITRFCYSKKCPFCYAPYEKFGDDATYQEADRICHNICRKTIIIYGIEKVVKNLG